jgi:hypothetical protein
MPGTLQAARRMASAACCAVDASRCTRHAGWSHVARSTAHAATSWNMKMADAAASVWLRRSTSTCPGAALRCTVGIAPRSRFTPAHAHRRQIAPPVQAADRDPGSCNGTTKFCWLHQVLLCGVMLYCVPPPSGGLLRSLQLLAPPRIYLVCSVHVVCHEPRCVRAGSARRVLTCTLHVSVHAACCDVGRGTSPRDRHVRREAADLCVVHHDSNGKLVVRCQAASTSKSKAATALWAG